MLSVNETNNKNFNVNIFPNPTEASFILDISSSINKEIVINIYDEIGKSVKSFKRKVFTGNNKLELNIDDLKPAIYFVSIKLGNELIHKQIIKK